MVYLNSNKLTFNKLTKTILMAGFVLLFGVSCGKKGPLYMPKAEAEPPAKPTAKKAEKQPAEVDTNNADSEPTIQK